MSGESPWVQMWDGRAVDLLSPKPSSFSLAAIARGLAAEPRWRGQTRFTWSVASHSLLVEDLLPPGSAPWDRLRALLHDAHEAVTGDMSTPMQAALQILSRSDPFGVIADRLQRAIHLAAGLGLAHPFPSPPMPPKDPVDTADFLALAIERRDLLECVPMAWGDPLPDITKVARRLIPETEQAARKRFIDRFYVLADQAGVVPMSSFVDAGAFIDAGAA
jgi:uncharacterized protein